VNIMCSLERPWILHLPRMQRVLTEHWSPAVTTLPTDALSRLTLSLSKITDSNETAILVQNNRVRAKNYLLLVWLVEICLYYSCTRRDLPEHVYKINITSQGMVPLLYTYTDN
jgi:hypothetical protein